MISESIGLRTQYSTIFELSDVYEIQERFAIMTIEGGISESEAIDYCRKHSAPNDFNAFLGYLSKKKSGR
jgi:hypothetical protein